ncbi:D-alanyl-D-alanine carboxypeptidase family protein [Bacillus sp. 165]|uniref:D-alanyl-D-alanine carboxypeptidase family protein n=1 Tax=Bacillus sp. 165 TaxID=1529117 RepID=UPI0032AFD6BE
MFALLCSIFTYQPKLTFAQGALDIQAEAVIMIEADSGKILFQKNQDTALPIASMTKMMTEYLVHEAVKQGKIKWDRKTTISEYAYEISQDRQLSNVPLENQGTYTVQELYEAMAIYSANGATIALAELIGGTEANFVKMMNAKAKELGLTSAKFVNSTGLTNEDLKGKGPLGENATGENILSAKDCAVLARYLIKEYPDVLSTAAIPVKIFRENGKYPITMINWNKMLPGLGYTYTGVDGLKTGHTSAAGYCFTGTAEQNGMRLITVVMKTNSEAARFAETKKLLDYGFTTYEVKELYPAGYQLKGKKTISVPKGKDKEVSIATKKAVVVPVPIGVKNPYKVSYKLNKKELEAPTKKETKVGYMIIKSTEADDAGFVSGSELKTEVVTKKSVEKANWFILMFRGIGSFFGGLWSSAVDAIKGIF